MAWSYVQSASNGADASGNPITCAYGSDFAAGSLLFALIGWRCATGAGLTLDSVTDSLGQTWTRIGTSLKFTTLGVDFNAGIFYRANTSGGANTVTATFSADVLNRAIAILEYGGVAASSPLDKTAQSAPGDPGTGTDAITSGDTASTAEDNELVIGAVSVIGNPPGTLSAGTGFTARINTLAATFTKLVVEDKNLATAGVTAATFTQNAAGVPLVFVATFKQAAGGGGMGPPFAFQRNNPIVGWAA